VTYEVVTACLVLGGTLLLFKFLRRRPHLDEDDYGAMVEMIMLG